MELEFQEQQLQQDLDTALIQLGLTQNELRGELL